MYILNFEAFLVAITLLTITPRNRYRAGDKKY